jgi:signal recognition particle subunit SRP54
LIAGLQGSGKTTFSAKLANFLKKQKLSPMLVAGDVYRPAAMEQLRVLGEQIGVDVHIELENKNPVEIAQNAIQESRSKNKNVIIIDTAGRLAVDEAMMTEVANIKNAVNPQEILFVVDSMTGQDAVNKPIKFVSSGEKMDTLDVFYPERMAQRILGMGDITTLVEKAQAQFDEEQARRLEKKIRKNQFDFADFKQQLEQIKKMGNLKDLMAMIPGVGKAMKDIDISDDAFKGIEAIINSMTPEERSNPDLIDGSRKKRIAKGCGKDISEVNAFMKQFDQMREMMKTMNKMPMSRMMPGMRR